MKRKIFAAFLSLMMVISMLPTAAFAEEVEAPAQCKHENAQWETVEEATCTESGKQVLHCHDCETDLDEKEIDPLGHDLQPTGEFVEPTCTKGAGEVYACSRCGYKETKTIEGAAAEPALGHDLVETEVEATCKEGSYTLVTCKRCDYSEKKNEKPADENAHKEVLQEPALKKATCTEPGIGRYVCAVCGKTMGYRTIPAGHTPVEATREEPTCVKDGKVTYKCATCGKELPEETKVLKATGEHTWVDGQPIDATCTEPAKVGKVCSVCGEAGEAEAVKGSKPLGHDMQLDTTNKDYKKATCVEDGLDTYKCSRCDETDTKVTKALGHNWVSAGMQEADCTHPAGEKVVCANDANHTDVVPFEGELAEKAKGHKPVAIPEVPATCSKTGLTEGKECSVCHEILEEQQETELDPENHNPVEAAVLKEADCKTNTKGIARMACADCGKNLGYKVIEGGHDFKIVETVEATCGKDGKIVKECTKCGKDEEEVLKATGKHTIKEETVEATCTEPAKVQEVCTVCGYVSKSEDVKNSKPLGHDMQLDTTNKDYKKATCVEDGLDTYKCSRCDETDTKVTKALGHNWVSAGVQEADCTHPAGEKFVCANDANHTDVVEFTGNLAEKAKGHKPVTIPKVPATCSKTGLTEGKECSVCHEILEEQVETKLDPENHNPVEAAVLKEADCKTNTKGIVRMACADCGKNLGYEVIEGGHDFKIVETVEATCGKDGKIVKECTKCGKDEEEVLKATGKHTFKEETVEATCTEPAKVVEKCTVCGAEGKSTDVKNSKPLGHDWELDTTNENYKKETCVEDGVYTYKCSRCPETKEETKKAVGKHTWDKGVNKDATCTKASGALYTCTVCGDTDFEEYPESVGEPAKGHTPKVIPKVPATCKTTGLTEGSECAVCHEILVEQVETPIEAKAHVKTVAKNLQAADCKTGKTGINRMGCELCGANLGYEVQPADHTPEVVSIEPATCGKDGKITYKCSVCGEELEPEVLPATDHTFDEKNVKTVDATCTEDAKVIEICTVCGAEGKISVVKGTATGHKWDEGKHVDATCEKDAHILYTCTVCKETKPEAYPAGIGQKALGHDLKKVVTPATCAKGGYTTVTCSRCDYSDIIDKKPVDANNHTWNVTHLKDATCTVTGIDRKVCADCGKYEYDVSEKLDHSFDPKNAKVTKEPTCGAAGEKSNECLVCHQTFVVETISNEGMEHTAEVIPETDTHTSGWKCSVCGKNLVEPEVKCEHKHTEVLAAKAATCAETGLTEGKKCTDCGKILVAQNEIKTLPHTFDSSKEFTSKEPTCAVDGEISNTCTVCGKTVVVETISKDLIDHTMVEIPETETMTEGVKCSVCGKILVEPQPKCEHKNTEILVAKAATCTATGLTEGKKCKDCGKVLVAQEEVPMTEHTAEVVSGKAATCTEDGLSDGSKCAVCGKVLVAQETVKALGHEEAVLEPVAPSCEGTGLTAGVKCGRCGEVLKAQEVIEAKGHTPVDFEGKEATCTEAGHTAGTKCADCGKILSGNEEIAALDHDFEFVDDTEEGVLYRCTRCGVEKVEN